MPASKIQDEAGVLRWFAEGRTYQWMCEEYERKYNITTVPSLWSNFRRERGLASRSTRDGELIPWAVDLDHRWAYPLAMLRTEARRRAGRALTEDDARRLESWLANLHERDLVVHYDPAMDEGFHYVPRLPDIDTDLIREPPFTTGRRAAD